MEQWISLLLFAAFFYVMMRYGCGAHMVHGGHGGHGGGGHEGHSTNEGAKDPVCGMTVEAGQGYSKSHQGRILHFCSRKCLDQFEAQPEQYVARGG